MSLNVGLRWEPYFPSIDVNGRDTHFELGAFVAGQKSGQFIERTSGIIFPGDPGMPDGGASTNHHLASLAPRVGIVWDPKGDGRMTVRGGNRDSL